MNTRLLGLMLLVVVMIGGLIAGFFAPAIQRALTVPVALGKGMPTTVVSIKPAAKPIATATATIQIATQAPILAQDTFKRANQPLWGTASDGQVWGGDANTNNNVFALVNGAGQIANGHGTFEGVLGMPGNNVDVVVSGMVNHFEGGINAMNLGVVLRWNDANDWYKALIEGKTLTVLKRVNGVTTTLDSVAFPAQGGMSYTIHFRAVGAMLFANAWLSSGTEPAQWMITTSDTDLTSGMGGVRVLVQNDNVVRISAFSETIASSGV